MELLTKKEAAEKLKISKRTIERWAKRGILKPLTPGSNTRAVRFSQEDLEKIFKSRN